MKKRYNNLSLYRIVATILVLQFHIFFICYPIDTGNLIFLSKFLQGLTALSGFLFSQRLITDVKEFYLSRGKRILIPAIAVIGVVLLWNLLFMLITSTYDAKIIFTSGRAFNGSLLIQPGNYYFLAYILVCYLITPILQRKDFWSVLVVIIGFAIETIVGKWMEPLYIVTCYAAGYYVGVFAFKHYVDKEYVKSDIIRFVVLAILLGVSIFLSIYLREHYIFKGINHIVKSFFLSLFGLTSVFLAMLLFKWMNRFEGFKVFEVTNPLSYYLFLFNQTFMVGATNVASYVNELWAKTLLVYLFVIVFSLAFYFISKNHKQIIEKIKHLNKNVDKIPN